MKKPALILLTLLVLLPFAQSMAQTAPVAVHPATAAAAPTPDAAQFLATLSGGQTTQTPTDLTPAPSFTAGCASSSQCPTGQLCCNVCGAQPLVGGASCRACVTPFRGRCPLVV
jgi:hypothetical protein